MNQVYKLVLSRNFSNQHIDYIFSSNVNNRYTKFATSVLIKVSLIMNVCTSVTYNFAHLKNVVQKGRDTDFLFQTRLTLDRITLLNSYKIAASTHKPNISIIECGNDDKISFNASVIFSRKTAPYSTPTIICVDTILIAYI